MFTNEVCSSFDSTICFKHEDISCEKNYWCNELCGDMCLLGEGSICFFEKISDIEGTCNKVKSILDSNPEANIPINPVVFEKHGFDKSLGDDGCARHSMCEYCTDECDDVLEYIAAKYGEVSIENLRKTIIDIQTTCSEMGKL